MSSFLNSALSSISDKNAQLVTPTVRPASSTPNTSGADPKKVPFRSSTHPLLSNGVLANGKRKADGELSRPNEKVQKNDASSARQAIGSGASDKMRNPEKPALKVSSVPSGPYRGTSKPSPVTPVSAEAKAPLKKGSFAEIMSRGKPTIPPVGIITHKPKEKISSKKELELQKREFASKSKTDGKISKSAPGSKSNSPGPSRRVDGSGKIVKPSNPIGYQGTVKPKPQPSYKGTMKPVSSSTASARKKDYNSDDQTRRKSVPIVRRAVSESEEEPEDDDENSYMSEEDFSDMEAGFEDVEEEDEKATRLAKKEDDFEKVMLDELKRQKEAKKRRLAALADKARNH
ncbi:hypothetical protein MMC30_006434 [Trapelia coarctata]|nr:hypothetical protein [Trapelia coarctata]